MVYLANTKIKQTKEPCYKNALHVNEGDSRQTWRVINELTSRKTTNCCVEEIKSNGWAIRDSPEPADAFNSHLSSIEPKLASEINSDNGPSHLKYITRTDSRFELRETNSRRAVRYLPRLLGNTRKQHPSNHCLQETNTH